MGGLYTTTAFWYTHNVAVLPRLGQAPFPALPRPRVRALLRPIYPGTVAQAAWSGLAREEGFSCLISRTNRQSLTDSQFTRVTLVHQPCKSLCSLAGSNISLSTCSSTKKITTPGVDCSNWLARGAGYSTICATRTLTVIAPCSENWVSGDKVQGRKYVLGVLQLRSTVPGRSFCILPFGGKEN